jgi:site-specific DNA recombinase
VSRRRLAAVPEAGRRAGLYVRVSAVMGRAGEDFLSPSIQVDTMRAAAARAGDEVVEVWEDLDVSGRSMTRPGLQQAQAAAAAGHIDVLYVHDLSRWARNAADGLRELAAIERAGVDVVSATEAVDRRTSSGRLTAGVLLLLAEHYSDLVGDRWRAAITANAERGVWHGRPPRGYVRTGRRELAPDPVLGPVWSEVFRRYAAGEGLRPLAQWLTGTTGVVHEPNVVSRTLRSPAYLGRVVLGDQVLPGRHEPLVDEVTWKAVQRRLEANARVPSRTKQAVHSLAGLLRCGRCGGPLNKRNRRDRNGPAFVYCKHGLLDRTLCQGIGSPPLAPLEAAVLEQLRQRLAQWRDTSGDLAAVEQAKAARAAADARTVQDELARTERALGALAVKLAQGVLSDTAYRAATRELEAALERLRAQAVELAAVEEAPAPTEAASLAEALLELWDGMPTDQQNAGLRTHVRQVHVLPATSAGSRRPRRVRVTWLDGTQSVTPRTASPQPQGPDGRFLPRG